VEWLKEGDCNTAFFHACASARRRTNKIRALVRNDSSRCEDIQEIKVMTETFYGNLFSSEPCVSDDVIAAIPAKVTEDMNEELSKLFTCKEIKEALFQMGQTKAPGLDGFSALFYETHWDFLKEDICLVVRGFLLGDEIPQVFAIQSLS
jgi:hypothetical protein